MVVKITQIFGDVQHVPQDSCEPIGNTSKQVDAVVENPHYVKKIQDSGLSTWLETANDTAKAILFTEKGTVSALLRAVAIDFLGSISAAQVRDKEKGAVKMFGVVEFPTLVLLPGGEQEPITHSREMKNQQIVEFLSQVTPPNLDPAPKKEKGTKTSAASSVFSEASEAHKLPDASDFAASASSITLDDAPTESTNPVMPPVETPAEVGDDLPLELAMSMACAVS